MAGGTDKRRFEGIFTALVTPFAEGGGVDEAALRALVEWQIEAGVHGLVPCGTTGENPTLSEDERAAVWRIVIEQARGRVPVIAGAGTNDTRTTIALCRAARELGADGALVVVPYYNKPTQAGLDAHFRAVADGAGGLPIVMYNVPGRTACGLLPDTIVELADHPHIVAVKEATSDLALASDLHRRCGDRLALLSGDDLTQFPFWAVGGRGSISVTANVAPAQCAANWAAFAAGRWDDARIRHEILMPLHRALFLEPNPIPVKTALALLGRCRPDVRLPLTPATAATREALARLVT